MARHVQVDFEAYRKSTDETRRVGFIVEIPSRGYRTQDEIVAEQVAAQTPRYFRVVEKTLSVREA